MDKRKLLIGVSFLCGFYFLTGPATPNNSYLLFASFEAALFSMIVLWAQHNRTISAWILLTVISSTLNFLMVYFWVFILIPTNLLVIVGINGITHQIISWGYYSSLGAFVYCVAVDLIVKPEFLTWKTYVWVIGLCFLAGVPLALPLEPILPIHKSMWWALFALGMSISSNKFEQNNANKQFHSTSSTCG